MKTENTGFYYLYGPTRTGKTTLLKRMNIELSLRLGLKVCQLSMEDLVSNLLSNLEKGELESFYEFFLSFDVLLIDNIWVLEGRPKTSETVFHLFERMIERKKRVVMAGDVPVKDLSQKSMAIKNVLRHLQKIKMPLTGRLIPQSNRFYFECGQIDPARFLSFLNSNGF